MTDRLRLVFAGTPEFAVPALHAARARAEVCAVYTQPDRPAGRGRQLAASPVKQAALAAGIEVRQPESLRDPTVQTQLAALQPDLMIVIAYGLILPRKVLAIPRLGCWNLHASLLPRWRGAAPIQRALAAGDRETGVCLMQMQAGLDTGPVLLREAIAIADDDTGGSLHDRLAELSARILTDGLTRLHAGTLPPPQAQPSDGVIYAHKLEKSEARLDWQRPADELARLVRALHPWPVAEAEIEGERVRIHAATRAPEQTSAAAPGTIVHADADGIDVACGEGVLRLLRLQRDGGKPLSARDFANARAARRTR